jgi:hypothetical protein
MQQRLEIGDDGRPALLSSESSWMIAAQRLDWPLLLLGYGFATLQSDSFFVLPWTS